MSTLADQQAPRAYASPAEARRAANRLDSHPLLGPLPVTTKPAGKVDARSSALVSFAKDRLATTPAGRAAATLAKIASPNHLRTKLSDALMRGRSETVDPFGLDPAFVSRWHPRLRYLYRRYFEVSTDGVDAVDDHGPVIVAANHVGGMPYDGLMLMYALRHDHPAYRTARPLLEDHVFHLPTLGPMLVKLGCVRACPENARRILQMQQVAIVFPEGRKGAARAHLRDPELAPFGQAGFAKLAMRSGAPIVPAVITGSAVYAAGLARHPIIKRVLHTFSYDSSLALVGLTGIPRRTRWNITFGAPIDVATEFCAQDAETPDRVSALAERVRVAMAALL